MLSKEQIKKIGFKSVGDNVRISEWARIYNAKNISIGNNVRIDDFTILSAGTGGITIGNNIHIGCHCSLIGEGQIIMGDYSGLSAGVKIFSSTDDFSGEYFCNAVMPLCQRNVKTGTVVIGKFSNIASNCVILPCVIHDNVAVGANSYVKRDCYSDKIYAGSPAKFIAVRNTNKYAESA